MPKPGNYASSGGGLAYPGPYKDPNKVPRPKVPKAGAGGTGLPNQPPPGSYDPALESQRLAAQRGMRDTLADLITEQHFAKTKYQQAHKDIHTSRSRQFADLATDFGRGKERIGNETADTQLKAARAQQDYTTKLNDIRQGFSDLAHRQTEAANTQGSLDAGTNAASAAARARNQLRAEAPIHTAEGRLAEDLATSLKRLGIAGTQLEQDYGKQVGRTKEDRDRENLLIRREYGQGQFLRERKGQRTRREGKFSNLDYLEQEIFDAAQRHPNAFSVYNPNKNKKRR